MKKLILIVISLLLIGGCSVSGENIIKYEKICESNKGIKYVTPEFIFNIEYVTCKNGGEFDSYDILER